MLLYCNKMCFYIISWIFHIRTNVQNAKMNNFTVYLNSVYEEVNLEKKASNNLGQHYIRVVSYNI